MSEIVIYQSPDGKSKLDVKLENNNIWLTQEQMGVLFNRSKSTINEHISNVFEENELEEQNVMRKFGNSEFSTKPTNFYNLEMIIAVGYRVKSKQGTQFRIWATTILKEYIEKGFAMNCFRACGARGSFLLRVIANVSDAIQGSRHLLRR